MAVVAGDKINGRPSQWAPFSFSGEATTDRFLRYIADESAEAKPRLKEEFAEATATLVFGVPTFAIDSERF